MRKLSIFVFLVLCAVPAPARAAGLPFMRDNYSAALRQAKQRNVPIFVEVWAPW
ncbi:MAG TPA: hypothetical protein VGU63_01355 [Candidatus Acidoferrales bacterium]|nr:hypothetical protein [Candidatus Acidoferrales bacterium]